MKKIKKIINNKFVSVAIIFVFVIAAALVNVKIYPVPAASAGVLDKLKAVASGGVSLLIDDNESAVIQSGALTDPVVDTVLILNELNSSDGSSSNSSSGSTSSSTCIGTATTEKCAALGMSFDSSKKICVASTSTSVDVYGGADSTSTAVTVAEDKCTAVGLSYDSTNKKCVETESFCNEIGYAFDSSNKICIVPIESQCTAMGKKLSTSAMACLTCAANTTTVANAVCGSVNGTTLSSLPSSVTELCKSASDGTAGAVSSPVLSADSSYWTWTCVVGSGSTARTASCKAYKSTNSGSANTTPTAATNTNTCSCPAGEVCNSAGACVASTTNVTTNTTDDASAESSAGLITDEQLAAIHSAYVAACHLKNTSITDETSKTTLETVRQALLLAFKAANSDKDISENATLAALIVAEKDTEKALADSNITANTSLKDLLTTAQSILKIVITNANGAAALDYGTYVDNVLNDFLSSSEKSAFVAAEYAAMNALTDSTLSETTKANLTEAMGAFANAALINSTASCPSPTSVLGKAKTACEKILADSSLSSELKATFTTAKAAVESVLFKVQNITAAENAVENATNSALSSNNTSTTDTTGNTTETTGDSSALAISASQKAALIAAQNALASAINDAVAKDAVADATDLTAVRSAISAALVEAFTEKGSLSAATQTKLLSGITALRDALMDAFADADSATADSAEAQVALISAHNNLAKALSTIGISGALNSLLSNDGSAATNESGTVSAIPVYRYYNEKTGDHYYKTSSITPADYTSEGIAFYAFDVVVADSIPVYKFYNKKTGDHYYKTSNVVPDEYVSENIAFYAYAAQKTGTIPVYRFYNETTGDHYYKTSSEVPSGYVAEGITFYAYEGADTGIVDSTDTDTNTNTNTGGNTSSNTVGAVCVSSGCGREGEYLRNTSLGQYYFKNNLRPTECCEGLEPIIPIALNGESLLGATAVCKKVETKACAAEGETIKNNLISRLYPTAPVNSSKPTECCDGLEAVSVVAGPNGEQIEGVASVCKAKKSIVKSIACSLGSNSEDCEEAETYKMNSIGNSFEPIKGGFLWQRIKGYRVSDKNISRSDSSIESQYRVDSLSNGRRR